MDSDFKKHKFHTEVIRHLFSSEIKGMIKQYAENNNLLLPDYFSREHYIVYHQMQPYKMEIDYEIVFYAREKTHEDILREQIEFQIQQLET